METKNLDQNPARTSFCCQSGCFSCPFGFNSKQIIDPTVPLELQLEAKNNEYNEEFEYFEDLENFKVDEYD